jgi:hypothetical protein
MESALMPWLTKRVLTLSLRAEPHAAKRKASPVVVKKRRMGAPEGGPGNMQ